jgi:hypothetical protein
MVRIGFNSSCLPEQSRPEFYLLSFLLCAEKSGYSHNGEIDPN